MLPLEAFSFARVIYDEFSYDNPSAALFVQHACTDARWILSATPPTTNLAAVCNIARLFDIHIARPLKLRAGLPRVTQGPEPVDELPAQKVMSLSKLPSDQLVRERQEQGHAFLQQFSSCNPKDRLANGDMLKVHEDVVVSYLKVPEMMRYIDLQIEFQGSGIDTDMLTAASRQLLPDAITPGPKDDGRAMAIRSLMNRASLKGTRGNEQPTNLTESRWEHFGPAVKRCKILCDKAIWLLDRVVHYIESHENPSASSTKADLVYWFNSLLSKNTELFGGGDNWNELLKVLTRDAGYEKISQHYEKFQATYGNPDDFPREFIRELKKFTSTAWTRFYLLEVDDLPKLNDVEVGALIEDCKHDPSFQRQDVDSRVALQQEIERQNALRSAAAQAALETKKSYSSDKAELVKLCRERGLKWKPLPTDPGLAVTVLTERLQRDDSGNLEERDMPEGSFDKWVMKKYPLLENLVKRRGGNYTETQAELCDVALQLKTFAQEVTTIRSQIRQAECIEAEPGSATVKCAAEDCRPKPGTEMYLVIPCGHLLCAGHSTGSQDQRCGDVTGRCCPSLIHGKTIPLSTINDGRRNVGHCQPSQVKGAPSSKTHAIVEAVQELPDDECGVLFYQFPEQHDELVAALTDNGIDFESLVVKKNSANLTDLRQAKVTLLQLDHETSSGLNMQWANHVMFASPLIVDSQEDYDAYMKQAAGRCIRYGQTKTVHVYHFVTAHTTEVDLLEARKGKFVFVDKDKAKTKANGVLAEFAPRETMSRVNSALSENELTKLTGDNTWLTAAGIEF
ncbi:hypothetical protein F5Y15DRAFT_189802 [Xylariaceae sp. FL0016]|nr:hypothetical protein F5Y15DRAFT_189802 [Xylariaceae sp. FL0016]